MGQNSNREMSSERQTTQRLFGSQPLHSTHHSPTANGHFTLSQLGRTVTPSSTVGPWSTLGQQRLRKTIQLFQHDLSSTETFCWFNSHLANVISFSQCSRRTGSRIWSGHTIWCSWGGDGVWKELIPLRFEVWIISPEQLLIKWTNTMTGWSHGSAESLETNHRSNRLRHLIQSPNRGIVHVDTVSRSDSAVTEAEWIPPPF